MRYLFHWFYCLPIPDAVLLLLSGTVIFLHLRDKNLNPRLWKTVIGLLLLSWLAVIIFGTLGQRTEGENLSAPALMPFYSYYIALRDGVKELYRANFMNVVLFYPAGLLGVQLLPKRWTAGRKIVLSVCLMALLSMGIEFSQYLWGLGLAETDDIIHNCLGALMGAAAGGLPPLSMYRE